MSAQSHASGSAGPLPGPADSSGADPLRRVADLLEEQTRLLRRISVQLDSLVRTPVGRGHDTIAATGISLAGQGRPGEPVSGPRVEPPRDPRAGGSQRPGSPYPPAARVDPAHPVHGVPRPAAPSGASPSYPAPSLPGRPPAVPSGQRPQQSVRTGPR